MDTLVKKDSRDYSEITSNLQNSWLHNESVYFFSGSFFAKYNLENNKISRLSDYLNIKGGISSVSWDADSVVFQTNPRETDRDDVTTIAQQFNEKPFLPHWWQYDFQTKQYQLLDFAGINACSSLVQINDKLLACAMPQSVAILFEFFCSTSNILS